MLFLSTIPSPTSDDTDQPHLDDSWETMLKELDTFVKDHGHARVPEKWSKNPSLARWVAYNRSKYRAGTLEKQRIEQLEKLGMSWNPYEADWEERYAELLEFHKQHGHCLVSQTQSELARWIVGQRYQYRFYRKGKPSHMTQDRIDRLNDVNFEWEPHETIWMNHYRELCGFHREHGHWYV